MLKSLVNRATAVDDLLNTQDRKAEVHGALDVSGDFLVTSLSLCLWAWCWSVLI